MEKKKTKFKNGQLLEIVECTFHDYAMRTVVRVLSSDLYSYQVVNLEGKERYWWVKENQVRKLNKIESKKAIDQAMRNRAFELRQLMGREWSREQLFTDSIWDRLNDMLEILNQK